MTVVSTAGHVDHGKSSVVHRLTGIDPDRFEEEKRRGLTIDLGFAHATLPSGRELSLVDVPGHVRFLRNMLAGVGAVDACLFVVAATEGWKPQSEEHLRILQLLGVGHGVVALTKTDLVDDEWRELQAMDLADRLAGTFLAGAPMVAVSSTTGAGFPELIAELDRMLADVGEITDDHRPRLWVDRVFAAKGAGTVVTGTLTGGSLHVDQRVDVVPGVRSGRVRGVQSHGRGTDAVGPGHRVAVNLSGIDHHQLQRGDALVVGEQWRPSRVVDASLLVLGALDHPVSRRGAYAAYIGSGEFPVKLRVLGQEAIAPGQLGAVRLHLPVELPLTVGDRFVLRESGRDETVGGGRVLDVAPVRPASKASPDGSVERLVAERGWVDADDLAAWVGYAVEPTVGRWVVDPDRLQADRQDLAQQVTNAQPLGLDVGVLGDRQRAVLATLDGVQVIDGRVRTDVATDPLAEHPLLTELSRGGVTPAEPTGVSRAELRELVRRGLVVERDGVYFHPSAIDHAAQAAARLLRGSPAGFTVAELRDALGVSRKFALPLVNELDGRGVTRRRGDVRIAGPRLPAVDQPG